MTCGIYSITHRETGAMYIGRSRNVKQRWAIHKSAAKKRKEKTPICRAIAEHGWDAFDCKILAVVPHDQLAFYERRFIEGYGTQAKHHYNRGGTESGWPTADERAAMPEYLQKHWVEMARISSAKGHIALRELRKDPTFEAHYCAVRSAAGVKREANIKAKAALDPEYAAIEKQRRRRASIEGGERLRAEGREGAMRAKASATFAERFETDADYAARVSENRRKAARASAEAQRILRQDPAYEAERKARHAKVQADRWARHHQRMESDPIYGAEYKAMRMRAGASTRRTYEERRACQSSKT